MPCFKPLILIVFIMQTQNSDSTKRVSTRQKCRAVRGSRPFAYALGALSLLLTSTGLGAADDLQLDASIALGFDSNPAQTRTGPDLAFTRYAVEASRSWSANAGQAFSLGGGGWYRDYEAANDAYRLNLLGEWSRESASGLGLWRLNLAGSAYRDALVPADERDEAGVGARYDHLISARYTLGLSVDVRQLDYLHPALPWAGRPGGASNSGSKHGEAGRNRSSQMARHRDDTRLELGLDVTRHWSPGLSTRFALAYAENDSSVHLESYRRPGLSGSLRLEPSEDWQVEAAVSGSLTRYTKTPSHREREDRQFGLSLALRRRFAAPPGDGAEWQCRLTWLDSDSTLADYSFQQWVTECGLSWSLR